MIHSDTSTMLKSVMLKYENIKKSVQHPLNIYHILNLPHTAILNKLLDLKQVVKIHNAQLNAERNNLCI